MKAEFANMFIEAARMTFEKELRVKLTRHSITKKETPAPSLPVSIVIGITGAVRGITVYSMDEDIAMAISKAMLPGHLPAELKKLMNSAVSELANIITGQATIAMAGDNLGIDITPPAVMNGKGTWDFPSMETICLKFLSEVGSIEINIGIDGGGN